MLQLITLCLSVNTLNTGKTMAVRSIKAAELLSDNSVWLAYKLLSSLRNS